MNAVSDFFLCSLQILYIVFTVQLLILAVLLNKSLKEKKETRYHSQLNGFLECSGQLPLCTCFFSSSFYLFIYLFIFNSKAGLTSSTHYHRLHLSSAYTTMPAWQNLHQSALFYLVHPLPDVHLGMCSLAAPLKRHCSPVHLCVPGIEQIREALSFQQSSTSLYVYPACSPQSRERKVVMCLLYGSGVHDDKYSQPPSPWALQLWGPRPHIQQLWVMDIWRKIWHLYWKGTLYLLVIIP
jgi:hypothetical protein